MKTMLPRFLWMTSILLVINSIKGISQSIDFGKSYVNITKGLNGGTIESGDTLEIRAVIVVRSGSYDSCAFFDNVPTGTSYIAGTIRVLTNEGKVYKQFTDAPADDEGWISGTAIRVNLGFNQAAAPARSFRRGRIVNTHKPSFYGSTCIMVASYRVRVTAAIGSIINTGGGSMTHAASGQPVSTFRFPTNALLVYTNIGMCPNLLGANSIGTEFNGSFGSGRNRNRGTSANVPVGYTYRMFNTGTPNDYDYGIANNTSTLVNYTTSNSWAKPDNSSPMHRVFGVWDIIGDHTGAASTALGNPAADTVVNRNAGYMLVVNASYRIDSAFQQTISGLCPNTYYEISAWIRNICSKCGCDSNGKGATNASVSPAPYIPTMSGAPGTADSSGVYPNLTFEVDGIDYYTTGNIRYTGTWVKKGFTFRTGPAQTSFILKFFNNAPGGGGNDWALDDISVATCYPNLTVNPTPLYNQCQGNLVDFGATVRSFFANYNQYKWQRSTNGGISWNDLGLSGTAVPVLSGGQYEYTVQYPPFIASAADSGHRYRLVAATTLANLSNPGCSNFSSTDFTTLNINRCVILPVVLHRFTGQVVREQATLQWATGNETGPVEFVIERSQDGSLFNLAGKMEGRYRSGPSHIYQFTDPRGIRNATYYRITVISEGSGSSYSRVLLLNPKQHGFRVEVIQNPFRDRPKLIIQWPEKGKVELTLMDLAGRTYWTQELKGETNHIQTVEPMLTGLPSGVYLLQARTGSIVKHIRLVKAR